MENPPSWRSTVYGISLFTVVWAMAWQNKKNQRQLDDGTDQKAGCSRLQQFGFRKANDSNWNGRCIRLNVTDTVSRFTQAKQWWWSVFEYKFIAMALPLPLGKEDFGFSLGFTWICVCLTVSLFSVYGPYILNRFYTMLEPSWEWEKNTPDSFRHAMHKVWEIHTLAKIHITNLLSRERGSERFEENVMNKR